MDPRSSPSFVDSYDGMAFVPLTGTSYLFGTSVEERSHQDPDWVSAAQGVRFIEVEEDPSNRLIVNVDAVGSVRLRSESELARIWATLGHDRIYLDITGLSHHVWAPMLRSGLSQGIRTWVVYREPGEYRWNAAPTEGQIFDLSERIRGLAPLPGFTYLRTEADNVSFVPLLGFEGTRFAFLLEQVQPPRNRVFPIVGVPGFRAEYPFHTYLGNRFPLMTSGSWQQVRYATANDPFSCYYALDEIGALYPGSVLRIAPIGTKPHAVGAILYALVATGTVEIVYDHPIRKPERTSGVGRTHVYDVSGFGPVRRYRP